jgi:hypothetical protein
MSYTLALAMGEIGRRKSPTVHDVEAIMVENVSQMTLGDLEQYQQNKAFLISELRKVPTRHRAETEKASFSAHDL